MTSYANAAPTCPVDDSVVKRKREHHHFPNDDLPVAHDRPLFDAMDAENADLWMIENRGRKQPTLLAERRDGEGRVAEVGRFERPAFRRLCKSLDSGGNLEQAKSIRPVNHRNDEPRVRRRRHPDVVILLVDELVRLLIDGAVQRRMSLERLGDRFDDERHVRETYASSLRFGLEPLTEVDETRDVAFFNEREVGRSALRVRHAFGGLPSDSDDGLPFLERRVGPVVGHVRPNRGPHVVTRDAAAVAARDHRRRSTPMSFASFRVAGVAKGLALK